MAFHEKNHSFPTNRVALSSKLIKQNSRTAKKKQNSKHTLNLSVFTVLGDDSVEIFTVFFGLNVMLFVNFISVWHLNYMFP